MDGRLPCCSLYAGGIMRRGSGGTVFIFHIIIDGSGSDDPSALVGRSVGRCVGRSVGRSHGRSVGRSVSTVGLRRSISRSSLVSRSIGQLASRSIDQSVCRSAGRRPLVGAGPRSARALGSRPPHVNVDSGHVNVVAQVNVGHAHVDVEGR